MADLALKPPNSPVTFKHYRGRLRKDKNKQQKQPKTETKKGTSIGKHRCRRQRM